MAKLMMVEFLTVVDEYGIHAREQLVTRGYHPKVIEDKAARAARKGYTDYGVAADRPWLLHRGRRFLDEHRLEENRRRERGQVLCEQCGRARPIVGICACASPDEVAAWEDHLAATVPRAGLEPATSAL